MMKRDDGRWMIASLGRWTRKESHPRLSRCFPRCCRFVPRPSEAVVPRPSGRTAGFTLVEILATFVLIAIILPVAMNGISMASKLASHAKRRVVAGVLAEQTLNDLVMTGDYENGDQEGEASSDNTAYAWRLEVVDWEEEDSMQQLNLSVTWEDAGGWENAVLLSTLVYTGSEE